MDASDALALADTAFRDRAWILAADQFRVADELRSLSAADLDRAAQCTYLIGSEDQCIRLLERAITAHLADGRPDRAGQSTFWLAYILSDLGEAARTAGWLARAERALSAQRSTDAVRAVRALLTLPPAIGTLLGGDPEAALMTLTAAREIGLECGHRDLVALSGIGVGQARILLGHTRDGLAVLDETMVSVTTGEVSPIATGILYCAAIITCHETYQLRRAAEWTRALGDWCDAQPDLVPFRGQCLVHRAEMLHLHGAWRDAMEQARLACRRLSEPVANPAIGMAHYELAELHRVRGEFSAADAAYRRAALAGHEVHPGLARLRLAQGNLDSARAGIDRALSESTSLYRPRMLEAAVEVAIVDGNVVGARRFAEELDAVASRAESTALTAMAAQAFGAVLFAEGDSRQALDRLRTAWRLWQDLDAPYSCAQVRVLQGRCCDALGDRDTAMMEFESAATLFRELGATNDLEQLRRYVPRPSTPAGLTPREVEVLRVVAAGRTNREIAETLVLSEKTVARHLSNIFAKLDVSSRSAATAYAYEHNLM